MYRVFCTGGVPEENSEKAEETKALKTKDSGIKLPFLNAFLGKRFAPFILRTPVKLLIVLVYCIYLGFAIFGITQMKEGLKRENLVPDNSHYVQYVRHNEQYFMGDYGPTVMFVIDEPLNYSSHAVQEELSYMRQTFERNEFFLSGRVGFVSWFDDFKHFFEQSKPFSDFNELTEAELVRIVRQEFLTYPGLDRYISDITFDATNSTIVASRMYAQSRGPRDANDERDIMLTSRAIAEDCKFNALTYNMAFIYFDQYTVIVSNTLQNLGIATASMLLVALLLIPSLTTVIWVTLTTVSIEVGVVGYMVFWGVSLDCVSMINLIMCIGFSVDFAAHISYHYTLRRDLDALSSAVEALGHLGAPIVQSAASTLLAVAILSQSESYIFRTFFKIVSLVMIFGACHALFLLPVLLSTIRSISGPRPSYSAEDVTKKPDTLEMTYEVVGDVEAGGDAVRRKKDKVVVYSKQQNGHAPATVTSPRVVVTPSSDRRAAGDDVDGSASASVPDVIVEERPASASATEARASGEEFEYKVEIFVN